MRCSRRFARKPGPQRALILPVSPLLLPQRCAFTRLRGPEVCVFVLGVATEDKIVMKRTITEANERTHCILAMSLLDRKPDSGSVSRKRSEWRPPVYIPFRLDSTGLPWTNLPIPVLGNQASRLTSGVSLPLRRTSALTGSSASVLHLRRPLTWEAPMRSHWLRMDPIRRARAC